MLHAGLKSADLHLSRAFASGHVFTPSLLDKLLAESYYNPRIVTMIELMVGGDRNSSKLHMRMIPSRLDGCRYVLGQCTSVDWLSAGVRVHVHWGSRRGCTGARRRRRGMAASASPRHGRGG